MITTRVDTHVHLVLHVTAHTIIRRRVFNGCELGGEVTLPTNIVRIWPGNKLSRMRIVAIGAGHARGVHLALYERSVNVHLLEDAPIRVIQVLLKQRQSVRIEQRLTVFVLLSNYCAASMAATAAFRLLM